jgi:O-antigen/teichoic acid export membrane protein
MRILNNPLARRVAKAISWSVAASIFLQASALLNTVILSRSLAGTEFGNYIFTQSAFAIFLSFITSGISIALIKMIAGLRDKNPELTSKILSEIYLMVLLSFFLFPGLYVSTASIFTKTLSAEDIIISAFCIFFISVDIFFTSMLIAFEKFKHLAITNFVKGMSLILFSLTLSTTWGLSGALIAQIGSAFLGFCVSIFSLYHLLNTKYKIEKHQRFKFSQIWYILSLSVPSFLGSVVINPAIWLANYIVVLQSGSAISLGYFGVARQWSTVIQFFPIQISQVILPVLSNTVENNEISKDGIKKLIKLSLILNIGLTACLTALIVLFSRAIGNIYGYSNNSEFMETFIVLSFTSVFVVLNNTVGQFLLSLGYFWQRSVFDVFLATFLVVFTFSFVNFRISQGLALSAAYLISFSIISTVGAIFLLRKVSNDLNQYT